MNIKQNEITIRNATIADAEVLCKWWNDGAVMAHAGFPNGVNTTVERIQASLLKDDDATHRRHILCYQDIPIGESNYRNLGNGVAELGIKICEPTMQSKGLGTIILSLIINELFEVYKFEKVILDTNTNNIRAQKTYQKLGFQVVGVKNLDWVDQNGVAQSSIDYELTPNNFINHSKK
ncbi:MAG TPA: GNAT family protein [Bacilli bacterium]|nr:GNAT family protein [Bacilli bacterium]